MRVSRKTVAYILAIAIVSFGAMCSGLDRNVHLSLVHADDCYTACTSEKPTDDSYPEHDPDDCPTCIQLTIGKTAVVEIAPPLPDNTSVVVFDQEIAVQAPARMDKHDPITPRAPPKLDVHNS